MNAQWFSQKWLIILLHALCWILLFSLPYFLRPSFDDAHHELFKENWIGFAYVYSLNRILWMGLFYLNANVITPKVFYKKKVWAYIGILVLIFATLLFMDWLFFLLFIKGLSYTIRNFFSFNFFPVLFVLTASTAYRMIYDRNKASRLQKEKEHENLKTELSLLRSQVSPHFMFNVLNNMVALARKGSDQLEPSLIKLSSLLRYMLYETDEKVPLQKEVEYLQSYIDLQQQRFGKGVQVNACMNAIDGVYYMEPMLLIPFVENAFKHGTGLIDNARIDIELKAEKNLLSFSVRNKFNEHSVEIKDKTSGIGLANVQRRLELLYGSKHSLLITKQEGWFIASLQIYLS